MAMRLVLILGLSFLSTLNLSSGYELVELNDPNEATLGLKLSWAVKAVQAGLTNQFKFERTEDVKDFLVKCKQLDTTFSAASDADYKGLAGKIKALLGGTELKEVCQVGLEDVAKFSDLDKDNASEYLDAQVLRGIVKIGEQLEKDSRLKSLLGHLYEKNKSVMAKNILELSANDVDITVNEPKTDFLGIAYGYKTGCETDMLKPICKLVRRTNLNDVTAIGYDFSDFKELLDSNKDTNKIENHEQDSGVTVNQMKAICAKLNKYELFPMRRLDQFKAAQFLNEQQIHAQTKTDPKFDFYYQLYRLCEV